MRITEVIIDGFKSYAVRTVISDWDASFNAITGLNGSGKSNILDAICFCLGIAKYELLRASGGVQDLIYKRGQAGVTKASVTLVFDNNDYDERGKKRLCPVGFEEHATISVTRQVVLGGTSKYLINGHRAQQQTVQNLFQSVQLNINNPNFLIMQGRVTKVLNMKSTEILGMVEEAAGTRMFEDRREKALRTMSKKQAKVEELEQLLKEEIEPKLDKLRGEKRAFLEFQSIQNDSERLTKLVIAYDYVRSKQKLEQTATEIFTKAKRMADLQDHHERLKREITVLEEDLIRVRNVRESEIRKDGNFAHLEETVKTRSHDMVRLATVLDLKRSSIDEEEERSKKAEVLTEALKDQLRDKSEKLDEMRIEFEIANKALDALRTAMEDKEELLSTLQTGISSNARCDGGYSGQLSATRDEITKATTEIEQSKLKISHLEKCIRESQPRVEKAHRENAVLNNALTELSSEIAKIESEMQLLGFDKSTAQIQDLEKRQAIQRIRDLKSEFEGTRQKVANLDFSYSDPSPGFNRKAVKGLVAQLFSLPPSSSDSGIALEICAGGRLYNVVVDTAEIATQLLQNGKLRRRVTIVPLDKISAQRASTEQIAVAQRLAPGKVHLAVSLIGYEDEVEKAMNYVFGNTLIAADAGTAKRVTFDPSVCLKSVTIQGDVYDPSGTLSGGSSTHGSGVLLVLQTLNRISHEIEQQETRLASLEQAIKRDGGKMQLFQRKTQHLELKLHEMDLAKQQIASNSSTSIIAEVNGMRETIAALNEIIQQAMARKQQAVTNVRRIENDMKDLSDNKTEKLKQLMQDVRELKTSVSTAQTKIKPLQQELRNTVADVDQTKSDVVAAQDELRDVKTMLEAQRHETQQLEEEYAIAKRQHESATAELEDEHAKLGGFDEELSELDQAIRVKSQQIADEKLESQSLNHSNEILGKSRHLAEQAILTLESEHEWIMEERTSFGKAGTPYSFEGQDMKARRVELSTVQERAQGMKRKINPAVMATIDSVEKKERDLKNMMRTVIRDRRKIEETISSLDEYKKEALHKTWTKVNHDFGMIFNDLLPGNTAKLDPPEGQDISKGLEVKVCLGKVWKQSLTELSGGQRSLIALSLILSLLQYSPAPMYILDEVDAALDLSHTQNIGRLIRTRFKGSQFIVVSLKDGMFTNANRIFRTRFMDGTSVVQVLGPNDIK